MSKIEEESPPTIERLRNTTREVTDYTYDLTRPTNGAPPVNIFSLLGLQTGGAMLDASGEPDDFDDPAHSDVPVFSYRL